jgi:hypothetical protein
MKDSQNIPFSKNPLYASAIRDTLKRKGLLREKEPTDGEKVIQRVTPIINRVTQQIEAILQACPTPEHYKRDATADLVAAMFRNEFNKWSKEDLVYLCVYFHVSHLIENTDMQVAQGLVGEHKDKPI